MDIITILTTTHAHLHVHNFIIKIHLLKLVKNVYLHVVNVLVKFNVYHVWIRIIYLDRDVMYRVQKVILLIQLTRNVIHVIWQYVRRVKLMRIIVLHVLWGIFMIHFWRQIIVLKTVRMDILNRTQHVHASRVYFPVHNVKMLLIVQLARQTINSTNTDVIVHVLSDITTP